jgi:hypothetical protein
MTDYYLLFCVFSLISFLLDLMREKVILYLKKNKVQLCSVNEFDMLETVHFSFSLSYRKSITGCHSHDLYLYRHLRNRSNVMKLRDRKKTRRKWVSAKYVVIKLVSSIVVQFLANHVKHSFVAMVSVFEFAV